VGRPPGCARARRAPRCTHQLPVVLGRARGGWRGRAQRRAGGHAGAGDLVPAGDHGGAPGAGLPRGAGPGAAGHRPAHRAHGHPPVVPRDVGRGAGTRRRRPTRVHNAMTARALAGPIPLVDLSLQHEQVRDEIEEGFARVIATSAFIDGPDVEAFEREFAAYCGGGACVGVANGTDALELLLRSEGLDDGSEVVLPANTFVATAEAVVRAGLRPVLVDCDEYHLLDAAQLRGALTPRTGAVVAVHLYGQQADLAAVSAALAGRPVAVFEDAAQAHGSLRCGQGIAHGPGSS